MSIASLIRTAHRHLACAADVLHTVRPNRAAIARVYIGCARHAWRAVQRAVALGETAMRHTYARIPNGWLAVVRSTDDACLWIGYHVYGKRQSAQRAALAERGRMAKRFDDAMLSGVLS